MTKSIHRSLAAVLAIACALAACDRSRPANAKGQWAPTTVSGLTLSSPGRLLRITTEVPAALDPAVRDAVQRIDSHGRSQGEAEIRVSRVTYTPGVALSLRNSAQGAVDAMRANPAVAGMTHTHAAAQTSGQPSLRTSLRMAVQDRPAMGEMLSVIRGQTLWQVQVLGPATAETDTLAQRVMRSITLEPEQPVAKQ
ncbi:hypothetical protein [Longimicrobium sp.]|uniref:hypothetical protein n=1 Tax=Longimicrobium sp. TaxID=2029185 RepID=UPI003B3A3DD2